MRILYISYDGILEPLGQSQVLRYLEKLSSKHQIHLISFEKPEDWGDSEKRLKLEKHMQDFSIHWVPLRYHKRLSGLATGFDIIRGALIGSWITHRNRIQIVHARSYVPSVIALALKKIFRIKYIFDMRGFWADERVDGGLWTADSRLYRIAKWFEQRFLLSADRVVSLTHAAVDEMELFPYLQGRLPRFEIITTCADLDLFKPLVRNVSSYNMSKHFILGYVGSVGVWYLFDESIKCFMELQRQVPHAQLHILNRGEHSYIQKRLLYHGISTDSVMLKSVDHSSIVSAMQQMDAGLFIIKPAYSKQASAPTKLGEFLGCGIPCLGNSKVGDLAKILEGEHVGVALNSFSDSAIREGVARLIDMSRKPTIRSHCRKVALRYFSLEKGAAAYNRIYNELKSEA